MPTGAPTPDQERDDVLRGIRKRCFKVSNDDYWTKEVRDYYLSVAAHTGLLLGNAKEGDGGGT